MQKGYFGNMQELQKKMPTEKQLSRIHFTQKTFLRLRDQLNYQNIALEIATISFE